MIGRVNRVHWIQFSHETFSKSTRRNFPTFSKRPAPAERRGRVSAGAEFKVGAAGEEGAELFMQRSAKRPRRLREGRRVRKGRSLIAETGWLLAAV